MNGTKSTGFAATDTVTEYIDSTGLAAGQTYSLPHSRPTAG